jgi:hypothetical protein
VSVRVRERVRVRVRVRVRARVTAEEHEEGDRPFEDRVEGHLVGVSLA